MKILAVDFDGTLATTDWPNIGRQRFIHKCVLMYVKHKQRKGWAITLFTLRENIEHKTDNYLNHAILWCAERGLVFDYVNENPLSMTKRYGYSRKVAYDILIDDKNAGIFGAVLRLFDK